MEIPFSGTIVLPIKKQQGGGKMEITSGAILIGGPFALFFLAIGLHRLLEYVDEKRGKKGERNDQ